MTGFFFIIVVHVFLQHNVVFCNNTWNSQLQLTIREQLGDLPEVRTRCKSHTCFCWHGSAVLHVHTSLAGTGTVQREVLRCSPQHQMQCHTSHVPASFWQNQVFSCCRLTRCFCLRRMLPISGAGDPAPVCLQAVIPANSWLLYN